MDAIEIRWAALFYELRSKFEERGEFIDGAIVNLHPEDVARFKAGWPAHDRTPWLNDPPTVMGLTILPNVLCMEGVAMVTLHGKIIAIVNIDGGGLQVTSVWDGKLRALA